MIQNYFKVALRAILRNKLTAFINIAGLALAMACALLIFLYVMDETRYDAYHDKADRTFRVTRIFRSQEGVENLHLANVAPPIGSLLKNDFGEIEAMARTINFGMVIGLEEDGELKKSNNEDFAFVAEPDIFKIFDIEMKAGDPSVALSRPFTILLSEKAAIKYFSSENIIGKRLRGNNTFDLEVTGVFKDFPRQSHWHPEFLISFSTLENDKVYGRTQLETNWGNNAFGTYLLLDKSTDAKKLEASLPAFLDKHFGNYARSNWGVPADWVASKATMLTLQKLTDIHLHSHLDDELEPNGNINNVIMMSVIGIFIILIACFNFINLSTARATKRAKEVGLRKVVGAFKGQLISQYLSESVLISFLSLFLAFVLASGGLPYLNIFTSKALALVSFMDPVLWAGVLIITLIIGISAGLYPAFILSSFNPVVTLKGQSNNAGKGGIRKTLVVFQFAISISLIIATFITFQQLSFLNERDLGYTKDQVITLSYYDELKNNYDAFYNTLTQNTGIQNVSRSSRIPTGRLLDSYGGASVMQGDSLVSSSVDLKSISTDEDFFDTYGIHIPSRPGLFKDIATDDSLAFMVNEAAARAFGWTDLKDNVNKDFRYADVGGKLVGIVSDFHFESLHQQIVPMVFLQRRDNYNRISVKVVANHTTEALSHIEKTWKQFLPNQPFEYQFLSERYTKLYEAEQKQGQLFTFFAGLAIFIASLGLFGLATFSTLQRMKEIGIRKVLGASVSSIVQLLSKEIVILILCANVLAWPFAWYFMQQWLNSFAYKIDMQIGIYLLGAFCALLIGLLTVSAQTVTAALRNPSSTLRHE